MNFLHVKVAVWHLHKWVIDMNDEQMMNIVVAGDLNVFSGIEAVIYSTMLHNKNVHWHILTMDLEMAYEERHTGCKFIGLNPNMIEWLSYIVRFMDCNSRLTCHDMHDVYLRYFDNAVNKFTPFTPYASLRLLIDVAIDIPHALYLDADIIVQDELETMYWKYLNKSITYAAYSLPGANAGYGEMISAVILFDLVSCRRTRFLERARYNYNHVEHKFPDQNALALAGDPFPLPETYNYMHDHKAAIHKPTILHFSNDNYCKIYQTDAGSFYRYYPEHRYIKDGLDIIRETYR